MKATFKNIILLAGTALIFGGCEKIIDEKRDLTGLGDEMFEDSLLTRSYVDYVYDQNLPGWPGQNLAQYTDESAGTDARVRGTLQVNGVGDFPSAINATNNYGKIRSINHFLGHIDQTTFPESTKERFKGQMLFFRAWRYFDLVRLYGGVPVITTAQNPLNDNPEVFSARNKSSETFKQIADDLDKAIDYLPGKWENPVTGSNYGRVTSVAAAALKGRSQLLWASPTFNPNDETPRWRAAYDANKQAKTLADQYLYGFHSSFQNMWFQEGYANPEAIFVTVYNTLNSDQISKNNTYDAGVRPRYLIGSTSGSASYLPTWQIVKAFPMKDGKNPGESSTYTYSDQLFYKDRDPRFYSTIAYNGATWHINGNQNYRLWTYYNGNSSVEPNSATSSGFYTRKATDPNASSTNVTLSGTDWMEIRYAEVVLNLAESACGINELDEALTLLKSVRHRAGIEPGTDGMYGLKANMTRPEMFNAILLERQVEFAFEGKRYWDMRRHELYESVLNGKRRTGVRITLKPGVDAAALVQNRDTRNIDDIYLNDFQPINTEVVLDATGQFPDGINWKPEYYFFPIHPTAISTNPNLVQNPGWPGGTFNPYE